MITKKQVKIGNSNFIIRSLRLNDENLLKKFFSSFSPSMKKWYSSSLFNDDIAEKICRKKDKSLKAVVILHGKKIVGYCVLFFGLRKWEKHRYNNKFEEDKACTVAPCLCDEFQNIGLGTEMFLYIIDISRYYDKSVILLWSGVVLKNKQAVHFYKKLNFKINRKWLHPIAHVMSYDMYLEI
jgi:GNAT superfamily N-acetyltransferase